MREGGKERREIARKIERKQLERQRLETETIEKRKTNLEIEKNRKMKRGWIRFFREKSEKR